ncbi:MAG: class SAM-dependent methyltransferase [Solirubrobacterales bacterium]|jgi:arsenite methyltransferase|nr:class SAM-dependent methyltransferase [Solirubrobacterales bacterium]
MSPRGLTRLRRGLSNQLSRPSGPAGRLVAVAMNRGNRGLNERAIELLDVQPGSRVLDLGFGGGLSFSALIARGATVVGVDRAHDMVDAARAKHHEDVEAGRLTVLVAEVEDLPLEDASLDRVLTINTVYFWRSLDAGLSELRRVLAPGGTLVIGIRDGSVMKQVSLEVFTLRSPQALAAGLGAAGYEEVAITTSPDGATHLVRATRT